MRIRVTTSINVRSNTVPSTPALVHDALPEDWNNYIVPEKENPTLAMPSLESAQSRLLASQRIPKGSRLSAWLHGFSVVGNQQRPTVAHHRKVSHTTTQCYSRTPRRSRTQTRPTGLRPANSTRGVIDPVHSPTTSCWPLSNQSFDDRRGRDGQPPTFEPYTPWTPATASSPHLKSGTHRRKKNLKSSNKKPQHSCFPHVNDPKLRHKIFGCLFFGTLLTLVLTTYLALATSDILGGPTFHGVFIFVILILTIIFSHYLIRLCMLSLHHRKRFGSSNRNKKNRKGRRMQWPGDGHTDEFKDDNDADLEAGFARPREPIPVTMVQDEELGGEEADGGDDDADEKELPPPPPAYGLWRSSVRADPNLIHWQSVPPTPSYPPSISLQGETRALVLARSGSDRHRPPSYVEEDTREVVGGSGGLRTVPAVAERRMVATVDYMRGRGRR